MGPLLDLRNVAFGQLLTERDRVQIFLVFVVSLNQPHLSLKKFFGLTIDDLFAKSFEVGDRVIITSLFEG